MYGGKVAIVTGGGSGIGAALGQELRAAGATVVPVDIVGTERPLDVTDEAAFRSVVADVIEEHGRLDLLVNNAGISPGGPTHEMTGADWDRVIAVNLRGVVNGILAAYPGMVERRGGQIINVASGAGLVGLPFIAGYSATKHAVVGLSTSLRAEAALHGVRVSALCPGAVETPILDRDDSVLTARQYLAVVRQKPIPADRFARLALRAIAKDRHPIVVPPSARSLWVMHRYAPGVVDRALKLIARRVDRTLSERSLGS